MYPVTAGTPSYQGTMIPEVWAGKILVKFYKATVFADISNTDYEGEIKNQGDTVHIRTTPNITIRDHSKGQKLTYEQPEPEVVDLLIDKGKAWSFTSDDVTKYQSDYEYVEDWTADAAKNMKVSIDSAILGDVYTDAHANNSGATAGAISSSYNMGVTGTPVALTKTNILDYIVDMGSVLDEQNIPDEDRYLVMPSWATNLIKKSDLKDASLSGDESSTLRNGKWGMIDRFMIYRSNSVSSVTDGSYTAYNMIFGHKCALTFASQLIENEGPMRDKDFFGDFYRGLQVYGYKVIKDTAFGHFYARKG